MGDLLFGGAVNKAFGLQSGRDVFAARLRFVPFSAGCNVQDHWITS
jgi:hypothetical protein